MARGFTGGFAADRKNYVYLVRRDYQSPSKKHTLEYALATDIVADPAEVVKIKPTKVAVPTEFAAANSPFRVAVSDAWVYLYANKQSFTPPMMTSSCRTISNGGNGDTPPDVKSIGDLYPWADDEFIAVFDQNIWRGTATDKPASGKDGWKKHWKKHESSTSIHVFKLANESWPLYAALKKTAVNFAAGKVR